MAQYIDLHTHTTASDGTKTPTELVALARQQSLAAIAVTDHDTTAGLWEAQEACSGGGPELVRGCELSVTTAFGELHVLGLWLPQDVSSLEASLEEVRGHRAVRNKQIVEKLHSLGVNLPYEAVLEEAAGDVVGRPHIARALVKHGFVPDERAAFAQYLRAGAAAYIPRKTLSAQEGVRLLAAIGATVAVAHPLVARCSRAVLETTLVELKAEGLDTIEVWHPEHNQEGQDYLLAFARRFDFGVAGGSDYHGGIKPFVNVGVGRGGLRVGVHVLNDLKARRRAQGLLV